MENKSSNIGISAFSPIAEHLLTQARRAPTKSSFINNVGLSGGGNALRQNFNLGYTTDNGINFGTSFGTSGGKDNTLQNVYASLPLTERLRLSAGYQPVAGQMGQSQIGAKIRYTF